MHVRLVEALGAVCAILITSCTGPTGPAGAPGEAGAPGARGRAGQPGPAGEAGVTIPVSCLSPCHGFNGVVAQFQMSVHYTEYLTNLVSATPEAAWTTTG